MFFCFFLNIFFCFHRFLGVKKKKVFRGFRRFAFSHMVFIFVFFFFPRFLGFFMVCSFFCLPRFFEGISKCCCFFPHFFRCFHFF